MAVNDISPGFMKITYSVGVRIHVMTLPVIPVSPDPLGTDNLVQLNDGTTLSFSSCAAALVNLIKGFFHTTTDFISAELWSKPTPLSNPIFIEAYSIGIVGTSATAVQVDGQAVLTNRTTGGGLLRLYLMESTFGANTRETFPFASGGLNTLVAFLKGNSGFIVGRDGNRVSSAIAFTTKVNDALRKRRLLL